MKCFWQRFMRWGILGSTGIFIAKTLCDRWTEVQTLQFQSQAGVFLSLAIAIAIVTELWSAMIWGWILALLQNPVPGGLGVFEASALQVLDPYLSPAILLGAVCVYRLVTLCA